MVKLIICRGVAGSGKSTWSRAQFGYVVISRDDLRVALYGSDGPDYYGVHKDVLREREDFITKVEHDAIRRALTSGQNVISDNTHTMVKYVNATAKVGWSVGAEVELKVFDVTLETALARNRSRFEHGGRNVPVDTIKRQHDQLAGSKGYQLTPPTPVKPYNGTLGKPKAFLFDLDGSVYHHEGKRGPYDHNVDVDDPDVVVQEIVNALVFSNRGYRAIAMSGRKTATREMTIECMNRDGLWFDALFMRADGDDRPDNIIKAELFDKHIRDNFDVQFVIDDRWQVCQMWLQMGLKVFNVSGLDRGEF